MRLRDWALLLVGAGAGVLAYGALVESKRLILERHTLRLKGWPESKRGYRIAVLTDMHVRDQYSLEVAQRAVMMALLEDPDIIVMPGDFMDYWRFGAEELVQEALLPLVIMKGKVIATPGNHEYNYEGADPERLRPVFDRLGIHYLRNEVMEMDGIHWVGLDSAVSGNARPQDVTLTEAESPAIILWHEPDVVPYAPKGAVLQISGHSHGGQFRFPGGFTPMHSKMGKEYPRGWYPDAPTPLYVSRGVGTTGPPTRWNCPPEVSLLTLEPA